MSQQFRKRVNHVMSANLGETPGMPKRALSGKTGSAIDCIKNRSRMIAKRGGMLFAGRAKNSNNRRIGRSRYMHKA